MKQLFFGIMIGSILGIIPIFSYDAPVFASPEWTSAIEDPNPVAVSPFVNSLGDSFTFRTDQKIIIVKQNGQSEYREIAPDTICTLSGNGKYLASFQKVGKTIDLMDMNGTRYWQIESSQYPYLTHNAKLVMLLVADLSSIKMVDINANAVPNEINGVFCTSLSFSSENDYTVAGFLDGTFYLIDEKGTVYYQGKTEKNLPVKSAAISPDGKFAAIHSGSTSSDRLTIVNAEKKKTYSAKLKTVHSAKTAISVSNDGFAAILDTNSFSVFSKKAKSVMKIDTPLQLAGQSSIVEGNGFYICSFRTEEGSQVCGVTNEGEIFLSRLLPEKAVELFLKGNVILARGTNSLYSWSLNL